MWVYSFINFLKTSSVFGDFFILLIFQSIPLLMPYFYLGLSLKSGHKFWHKTMPLVSCLIPVLYSVMIIDEPFSGVILKESSNDFQEIGFVPTISFSIHY